MTDVGEETNWCTMKTRFRSEDDGWTLDGSKITDTAALERIRKCLADEGPIILEHCFYRGSSAPDRVVFEVYDEFIEYLNTKAFAGDAIHVWSFAAVCRNDNTIAYGKCPDDEGMIPRTGAY